MIHKFKTKNKELSDTKTGVSSNIDFIVLAFTKELRCKMDKC